VSDPRHALGLAAEDLVADWLTRRGWQVVGRRLRSPAGGEVDLVARDLTGVLVAVEVRARRSARAGAAATSVDARRLGRLRGTLAAVAAAEQGRHTGLRVDLVTVEPVAGQPRRWRLRRLPGIG
jgi:putative endonuclease